MALACLLTGDSLSLILTPLAQSAGSSVAEMDIDAVVDLQLSVVLVLLLLRGGIARCVRRDVVTALPCDGAFATESLLSGRLVGGPDGAWAGTGEGDRGGSRVALRSRRDSRLGSRLVRSCQLSRSKKRLRAPGA